MAEWLLLDSEKEVAEEAVRRIHAAAADAIAQRGAFHLVLAGGSSPLEAYRMLAQTEHDLALWHLYYGDERCLPIDHPQRNCRMISDTGLPRRVGGHHPIPAELGPESGAAGYLGSIQQAKPFDMVLLGMGEDGHTASLFPGHQWPEQDVVPVYDSPKPPPQRISLTPRALQDCRQMLVLATGEGKRAALRQWREGVDLPIGRVAGVQQATILVPSSLVQQGPA